MRGDLGTLYDAHAVRLHAHCWSLIGDEGAAAAVRDTFVAAVQHPPRGDSVLWLYALSRSACASLGAFSGDRPVFGSPGDPLLRAAADLRADQREALLLWSGEWLEVPDIARVLGIAPDTVHGLVHAARTRLERAVLDRLMRGAADPAVHMELITAFEKGRLPRLLAGRVPDRPPAWLRDQVLAACADEVTHPLSDVVSPSPLVVIGSEVATRPGRDRATRRKRIKSIGAVAGMAASVAAAVGLLVSWPTAKGGGMSAVVPSAGNTQTGATTSGTPAGSGTARPDGTSPNDTAPGDKGGPAPSAATEDQEPAATAPRSGTPDAPATSPDSPKPTEPGETTTPPEDTTPPESPEAPPTDPDGQTPPDPSQPPTEPSEPPDPSQPPTDPPTETPGPGPSPTSNPTPSPSTTG
ncbi:hypothetical protein [Actinomadura sp. 9N407]|uniref:hypothetical protein n=1 Tax=Actinomadura sp. 9N407 TaxID=3375154 RepID=UPI0037A75F86